MGTTTALQTLWTGWLVAALLATQIALPFLLRRARYGAMPPSGSVAAAAKGDASATGMGLAGNSMRWHYLLGFILPAAALVHGWIPMGSGHMPRTSMTGLWLATYALGLLFLQLVLGLVLQRMPSGAARVLRWVHFFTMLVITALALAHMLLN
ncbi:MAG TPA: hypothetical protein VKF79_11550 [Candidatus Acidoferrum sp.]|nr:hypothetical protein [Candidatus Acidoferrum sp.]